MNIYIKPFRKKRIRNAKTIIKATEYNFVGSYRSGSERIQPLETDQKKLRKTKASSLQYRLTAII